MRLSELFDLLPRSSLLWQVWQPVDEILVHALVQAVVRVLGGENPLDACFGCRFDEAGLRAHGHEAQGEDCRVLIAESRVQEVWVRVGAFLDRE